MYLDGNLKAPEKTGGGNIHSELLRVVLKCILVLSHLQKRKIKPNKKNLSPSRLISNVPVQIVGEEEMN